MDITTAKVIDISRPLNPRTYKNNLPQRLLDTYAGRPIGFQIDNLMDRGHEGQLVRGVSMRLHAGTHIDCPEHWIPGGKRLEDIPLTELMGPAIVFDVTDKKAITEKDLEERIGHLVKPGSRVLVRTGWNDRFFGLPHKDGPMDLPEWKKDSPYFTRPAIEWLLTRKIALLGIDFLHTSHEPGAHHDDTIEPTLVKAGVITLTNLCNMTSVTKKEVYLIVLPLALQEVEAGPARAIVLEN